MNKKKTAAAIFIIVCVILFASMTSIKATLRHGFETVRNSLIKETEFVTDASIMEIQKSISLFPWNQYHKYITIELSEKEVAFLREKKAAECMIDIINYEDTYVYNKDIAVSVIYNSARKLITDDNREYYVWYETLVEDIYIYSMMNMNGQIFTFRFVTDLKADGEDALNYLINNYQNNINTYLFDNESSKFEDNRKAFLENAYLKLTEYENLDAEIFYKGIDLTKKPCQLSSEKGSILMEFTTEAKESKSSCIFLYFDNNTQKISGYHLLLY